MVDIICIGHAAYDINFQLPSFPKEDLKLEIFKTIEEGGGPAANAAFLLSKWGVQCAFAGLIGNDLYGNQIKTEFEQVGTDLSLLEVSPEYQTPLSVVLVNKETGSRTIINRKANDGFLSFSLDIAHHMNPAILMFDGHEPQASLAAIQLFPKALTILDAGSLRPGTEILAREVEYLVCSKRFALSLTGIPDLKRKANQQDCLYKIGKLNKNRCCVVTLGEDGLIWGNQEEFFYLPAFPARAVDTTAAGDIFHGAFAYGILTKKSIPDALKFAAMAASLSVSRLGGRRSIPSINEVNRALEVTRQSPAYRRDN